MSFSEPPLLTKVAIVTGSAQGLGRAMAQGLALAGADVVGVDRSENQAEARQMVESTGRQFLPVHRDVAEPGSPEGIVEEALKRFSQIDILVNNAGITRKDPILDFTQADWDDVLAVNLRACFLLSQAVARHLMSRQASGAIINIASLLAFQGSTKLVSYTVSKTGLVGLTKAMANELAPHNIRVNAIAPGYMDTENTAALRSSSKAGAVLSMIPMGRWGQPGDLQGPVVFLASEMSAYITGHVLVVDGGWLSGNV
jgi:2-dehydro-3-deoxy-D-gluconate 5-dehydrogenase